MPLKPLRERDVPPFDAAVHFLDGRPQAGAGEPFAVGFPVTGETLAELRAAGPEQVERALASARRAFDDGVWRHRPAPERAQTLERMADTLLRRLEDLRRRIVFDNGKTPLEAGIDVHAAVAALRQAARYCLTDTGPAPSADGSVTKLAWREPVGVVAAVTPFNAPLPFTALKCAPALASGCSVVLKPSERAPLVPLAFFEAAAEAGVPAGVLSLLHGGPEVAAALSRDPRVDMITLTGGTPAGSAVMQAAAPTIKNLLLELGGKSAHIVLGDADLELAIPAAAAGIFRNCGQRCFSGSRLLVEESVADAVERGVAELASSLCVGDPFEPETEVGALIDERAVAAAEAFVERARAEGLRVAAGGGRIQELRPGAFFRPTVLLGASASSYAAQTELFGPVLTVIRVKDQDEAVAVANQSRYGLAGGVFTRDAGRALDVARQVRCGTFWINTYGAIFGDMPFGGYGQSGLGREAGRAGYEAYTEAKSVIVDTSGVAQTAPLFRRGSGPLESGRRAARGGTAQRKEESQC